MPFSWLSYLPGFLIFSTEKCASDPPRLPLPPECSGLRPVEVGSRPEILGRLSKRPWTPRMSGLENRGPQFARISTALPRRKRISRRARRTPMIAMQRRRLHGVSADAVSRREHETTTALCCAVLCCAVAWAPRRSACRLGRSSRSRRIKQKPPDDGPHRNFGVCPYGFLCRVLWQGTSAFSADGCQVTIVRI